MTDAATLVVGPSWVGDMVMAQSLFKLLKAKRPGEAVDVLAPGWSLPVVARMPEIRNGIAAETAHGEFSLATRRRIGKNLRGHYARAIVLPRSFKSALVPWFAGVPLRTGFRGEMRFGLINDMRSFDSALLDQTVKRFVALGLERDEALASVPHPSLTLSADNQQALAARLQLALDRPLIAFMPGAEYGPAKCWPHEHFATLAKQLLASGYRICVLGSDKDRAAGEQIVGAAGDPELVRNFCGETSLEDVIDLLGMTEQAVSNDSGLMHVAAAVGTHVHALYGSTSPHFTPPLTDKRDIYYLDIECSPCNQRVCPLGHLRCLMDIDPAGVAATVLRRQPSVD